MEENAPGGTRREGAWAASDDLRGACLRHLRPHHLHSTLEGPTTTVCVHAPEPQLLLLEGLTA